ncbi:MAG: hypothetical protein ACTSR3_12735 [Candidatus Helarchaeota archaeon]
MEFKLLKCPKCQANLSVKLLDDKKVQLICLNSACNHKIVLTNEDNIDITNKKEKESELKLNIKKLTLQNYQNLPVNDQTLTSIGNSQKKINKIQKPLKFSEFIIYCIDITSRMDLDIPYNESIIRTLKEELINNPNLPESLKEALVELINPPISYYRALIFILSRIITNNILDFGKNGLNAIQIILLAERAEEIFIFPNFSNPISLDIILDFIKEVEIKRIEYKNEDDLRFRNLKNAIAQISESVIDLKESITEISPKIFLIINGDNYPKDQKYFNPLKEIDILMHDLTPFSFNIFNLNYSSKNQLLEKVAQKYNGIFTYECTFNALLNALLKNDYGTEHFCRPVGKEEGDKLIHPFQKETARERPTKSEAIKSKPINIKPPKIESTEIGPKVKQIDYRQYKKEEKNMEQWEKNKMKSKVRRKADNLLDNLINK